MVNMCTTCFNIKTLHFDHNSHLYVSFIVTTNSDYYPELHLHFGLYCTEVVYYDAANPFFFFFNILQWVFSS